jgi:hypothetical protein
MVIAHSRHGIDYTDFLVDSEKNTGSSTTGPEITITSTANATEHLHEIALRRVSEEAARSLRILALRNLSPDICDTTPVYVHNEPGSTWGNRYINFRATFATDIIGGSIYLPYATATGALNDLSYWSSKEDCPTIQNKMECTFLKPQLSVSSLANTLVCGSQMFPVVSLEFPGSWQEIARAHRSLGPIHFPVDFSIRACCTAWGSVASAGAVRAPAPPQCAQ